MEKREPCPVVKAHELGSATDNPRPRAPLPNSTLSPVARVPTIVTGSWSDRKPGWDLCERERRMVAAVGTPVSPGWGQFPVAIDSNGGGEDLKSWLSGPNVAPSRKTANILDSSFSSSPAHASPEGLTVLLEEVAIDEVDHSGVTMAEDLGQHPGIGAFCDEE